MYMIKERFLECLRLFGIERRKCMPKQEYSEDVFFRTENGMPVRRLRDRAILESRKVNTEGHFNADKNNPDTIRRQLLGGL